MERGTHGDEALFNGLTLRRDGLIYVNVSRGHSIRPTANLAGGPQGDQQTATDSTLGP